MREESATARDNHYDGFERVVEIASDGLAQAFAQVLRDLADPEVFRSTVTGMAESRGLPQVAVDDMPGLFNDFWALIVGVNTGIKWLNHSGAPVRSGVYASEPITPAREQPSADGPAGRGGIVLHSYFSF